MCMYLTDWSFKKKSRNKCAKKRQKKGNKMYLKKKLFHTCRYKMTVTACFFFQHVVVHQIRQAQFDGLIIYQKCNYWGKTIGKLLVSFTDILSKFIFTVHFSMMYSLCTLSKQEILVYYREMDRRWRWRFFPLLPWREVQRCRYENSRWWCSSSMRMWCSYWASRKRWVVQQGNNSHISCHRHLWIGHPPPPKKKPI